MPEVGFGGRLHARGAQPTVKRFGVSVMTETEQTSGHDPGHGGERAEGGSWRLPDAFSAEEVAEALGLDPHPEGGLYRETWRHVPPDGRRGAGTAIYYLLREHEVSAWHRIDAAEIWHFYGGAPLELSISSGDGPLTVHRLGMDLGRGERPQAIVPPGAWQSARCLGAWSLVGCTVSPAFEFARFETGPAGWSPDPAPKS
jgi:hypothetical protein